MSEVSTLFDEPTDWLAQLPSYQRDLIDMMLAGGNTEEAATVHWLTANTLNLAPFGGEARGRSLFVQKFNEEIHAFVCSDDRYGKERSEVLKQFSMGQTSSVTGISLALAGPLSAAGPFLAPAVALTLVTIGKLGLNAWCAAIRERDGETTRND